MKPLSGGIPEKIAIITGESIKIQIGSCWDIPRLDYYLYGNIENDNENDVDKIEVLPAFIADASNIKSINTGKQWASRYNNSNSPNVIIKKNTPIKNVKICSLEFRGTNGVVYKVLADNFYVDCREDVILDTILQEGIDKGGILRGEFIWAKQGAQSKLVRIGSTIHKMLLELGARKNLKPFKNKDLIPGTIYLDKKGYKYLFAGYVNTIDLNYKFFHNYKFPTSEKHEFDKIQLKNHLFIFKIPEYKEKNMINFLNSSFDNFEINHLCDVTLKQSFVESYQTFDANGFIKKIRDHSRKMIKKRCCYLANPTKQIYNNLYNKRSFYCDVARYSKCANMFEAPSRAEEFDYEELFTFM